MLGCKRKAGGVRTQDAGVDEQFDVGGNSGVDHMLMLCEPLANLAGRDQQDFLYACESLAEGFGLRVVRLAKLHTQLCQARSLFGITNDCHDLPCWHLFQKTPLDLPNSCSSSIRCME